jgi:hypothetical protein
VRTQIYMQDVEPCAKSLSLHMVLRSHLRRASLTYRPRRLSTPLRELPTAFFTADAEYPSSSFRKGLRSPVVSTAGLVLFASTRGLFAAAIGSSTWCTSPRILRFRKGIPSAVLNRLVASSEFVDGVSAARPLRRSLLRRHSPDAKNGETTMVRASNSLLDPTANDRVGTRFEKSRLIVCVLFQNELVVFVSDGTA